MPERAPKKFLCNQPSAKPKVCIHLKAMFQSYNGYDLEQPLQLQASFKPTDGRERTISRFLKSSSIASQERCPDTS